MTRRRASFGQAATVDAVLFMAVMLVACAVIIGSAGRPHRDASGTQQYAGDFARTLLATDLGGLIYTDAHGHAVDLGDSGRPIGRLLCDEAAILGSDTGKCDFSAYNARILAAGKSLIRPDLDFAVSCDGGAVFISESLGGEHELPHTRSASQIVVYYGGASPVTVTVYVWVV